MLVVNPLLRVMDALDKKARQLALNGPRTRCLALAGFVKRPQAANLLYASSVQIGAASKYRRKPTMRQFNESRRATRRSSLRGKEDECRPYAINRSPVAARRSRWPDHGFRRAPGQGSADNPR